KDIKFEGGSSSGYLDVFYDKDNVKDLKPVIIFVHGGAWISGNKNEYIYTGDYFFKHGYVAVNTNYVLFPKGKIDDMVNDVYQAIMWTYNNIEKYGGNKKKISLVGYSAGAHLMALTTLKAALRMENNDKYLEPLPRAEKLVLFNGPLDFDDYEAIFNIFKDSDTSKIENGIIKKIVSYLFNSEDIGPTDILQNLGDNSIKDFGFPKVTVYHGGNDKLIPSDSSGNFIKNIKRVSPKIKVNDVFRSTYDHKALVVGASENKEEMKQLFLEIIEM
ncbi:hypothetical protein PIROE2DRAFT_8844, partial [Piromyces sp. E2]